jgi:hypothetical protein
LFEPIFSYFDQEQDLNSYFMCDVSKIIEIATIIRDYYNSLRPPREIDSRYNFNERDLLSACEYAGFSEVHLQLHLIVEPQSRQLDYESYLSITPFPDVPPMRNAMERILSPEQIQTFERMVKPQINQGLGTKQRSAHALIYAIK